MTTTFYQKKNMFLKILKYYASDELRQKFKNDKSW